jgi:hypothetical protein
MQHAVVSVILAYQKHAVTSERALSKYISERYDEELKVFLCLHELSEHISSHYRATIIHISVMMLP